MSEVAEKLRKHANAIIEGWGGTADNWESYASQTDDLCREAADEIQRLTRELAEARDKALEEAAAFVEAHAALETAGICDLSETSDPPLKKDAERSVFEANARKSAQAATYKTIAAAIRALKEKP